MPDATLGNEASTVTPNVPVRGSEADLIEGGALRGSNLFHSFQEFNVDAGQRLYFANPAGVESILSRITGGNPSAIFGTLGVDGAADLFLINPNGLVFGETATLDIQGSFYASTGEAIPIGDGVYSATAPEQSTLLTVNPSALFSNYLSESSGNIVSRAPLAAGENLILAANQLDLQRQVAAGGDLMLLGNTVQIRDAVDAPFVGFAGGDLLVQGNEQVDIVALSHPDSGLYSYGDMVLRSQNPVGGDAHYWSGGNFTVETLDGSGGSLYSPIDPIIRSLGDVFFEVYVGSSLHILAGGSVAFDTAVITDPDPGVLGIDFLQETITLSDSTVVQVDGGAQPTLDVRAGVRPEFLGAPPIELLTGFDIATDAFDNLFFEDVPSSANIIVGDVLIAAPNGLVLLTNQYQPNTNLSGSDISIVGGSIFSDSGINVSRASDQGGAVYLDARGDVSIINSFIDTSSAGDVGNVVINANSTVRLDSTNNRFTGVFVNLVTGEEGVGGDIRINATNLEVVNGAQIGTVVSGRGQGGNVELAIRDTVRLVGSNPATGIPSSILSSVVPTGEGNSGNIQITARNLEVLDGARIGTGISGLGNAGNIDLNISEMVRLAGFNNVSADNSGVFSIINTSGEGVSGNIQITAGNIEVSDGAQINTSTFGSGNAGSVILETTNLTSFIGSNPVSGNPSGAFSSIESTGNGVGGNIQVTARVLTVLNGAVIDASTLGVGNAGSVILDIAGLAQFVGADTMGLPSGAFSRIYPGGVGAGGNVEITAGALDVLAGALLDASTFGLGNAGNVTLNITNQARFAGSGSIDGIANGASSSVQPMAIGAGGNLQITASTLEVSGGSTLSASSFGSGNAGSVTLDISELARFVGIDPIDGSPSGASSSLESTGEGTGGNLQITASTLEVSGGATLNASTSGIGNAGNVTLDITELVRLSGSNPFDGSPSGAFSSIEPTGEGAGGNVEITTKTLEVLDGAQIGSSTFGVGNAGNILLNVTGLARFVGSDLSSGVFSSVEPGGNGRGGNVQVIAGNVEVLENAALAASSFGFGNAGNIILLIPGGLLVSNGTIATNSQAASGGQVSIQAGRVLLRNDGDIQTFVNQGAGGGGNITIASNFLIALEDSDILAFSADGRGGIIDLSRTTFFGQNPSIAARNLSLNELLDLDGNDRVDINATGGIESGQIFVGDATFVENSLTALTDAIVDTSALTAGSCIARNENSLGSFVVTGRDGLPATPGDGGISAYPTGTVRTLDESTATVIQEPDGVYQLPNGRLVLGRACN
ncbi:filamentous hemagglutinin N-terminal domain-containing protein [Nodosilinea sp. LEGE 06152]|uniref:beta strand repeat-containing protein n=1 Tax=Nodosilinea sp. LEGE 06152 TaxID=2777966 RepID=UPI001D15DF28